jgi:hypothetical protein
MSEYKIEKIIIAIEHAEEDRIKNTMLNNYFWGKVRKKYIKF